MKIAIGCDPNAQAAKEEVIAYIAKKGYGEVTDFGSEDCRKPDQKAEDKRQQYGDFSCGGVEVSKNYYRENRRMR